MKDQVGKPPRAAFVDRLGDVNAKSADNMTEEGTVDLNFKVSPDFKIRFKTTASARNISMKRLLEDAFECWINKESAK